MDYSIGMFLAELLSGAGIGWYASKLHIHASYGHPKDLKRDAILYKHLFFRASLAEDGDQTRYPGLPCLVFSNLAN